MGEGFREMLRMHIILAEGKGPFRVGGEGSRNLAHCSHSSERLLLAGEWLPHENRPG